MRRSKLSKRTSKKIFRKTSKVKRKNLRAIPMRGGFRL